MAVLKYSLDEEIERTVKTVMKLTDGIGIISTLLEITAHNFRQQRINIVEAVTERWPEFEDRVSVKYAPKFAPLIKLRLFQVENNEAVDQNVRNLAAQLRAHVK